MSVLVIIGRKCTLAASRASLLSVRRVCWVCAARSTEVKKTDGTDRQTNWRTDRRTDGQQTVALRLPLDAASLSIRSQHSQQRNDPRLHWFCYSWPFSLICLTPK